MKRTLLFCIIGVMLYRIAYPFSGEPVPGAPPVITTTPGYTEFEPGDGAVTIDGGVTATDEDSPKASKAIVKLANLLDGGNEIMNIGPDVVDLANDSGLTINYNFTSGELTITGEADFSVYQRIFREVTYNNLSPFPDTEDRVVVYTVFDTEGNQSAEQSRIIKIKNVPAVITEVTTVADGLYGIGDKVSIVLVFNRPVWVNGGEPDLTLQIGDQTVSASYTAGSGSNELEFSYTVEEGDLDEDGIGLTEEVNVGGASIVDSEEEAADLTIGQLPNTSGVQVDGIRPIVSQVMLPEDATYSVCGGSALEFTLDMSEPVTVNGPVVLQVVLDSGEILANLDTEKSSAERLIFTYEIISGDVDEDGIEVVALQVEEEGIMDLAGNALIDLELESTEIPAQNSIIIDGSAPPPPQVTGISPDTGTSDGDQITNTSSITITGTAEPNLAVSLLANDEKVGEVTADDSGDWAFDATELAWEEGQYELAAVSVDGACNASESSNKLSITIDMNGPVISTVDQEITLGENGEASIAVNALVEAVSDNFSSSDEIVLSLDQDLFTCDDLGENEVSVTATDIAGNVTETIAMVTVTHSEALSFVVEEVEVSLDENGAAEVSYTDMVTGLSGTCLGLEDFSYELSRSSFGCADLGEVSVDVLVTGDQGFAETLTTSILVVDSTSPTITGTEENIDIYVDASGEYVLEDYLSVLSISDNCTVVSQVQVPAEGTVLSGYETPHPITVTAVDQAGNESVYEFTITLKSNIIASLIDPEMLTVSWGTAPEDLPLPMQVEAVLVSGVTVMVDVVWDIQQYDELVPGIYQNAGTLNLGDHYSYDGDHQPNLTIMVNEKSLPEDILLSDDEFSVEDDPNAPLGILTTVDEDDDQHTYALTGEYEDEQYFYILGDRLFWTSADMPDGQQEFTITVSSTDRMGNSISKTFMITRSKPDLDDLNISNVFSPNGDGINDSWGVSSLKFYGDVKLMVFERGGKMVFVTYDPEERWDGRYEGGDLPVGAYYYVIELGEERQKRRGVLNLIRN
ncbi:Ig-like domain-containing protein [Echinicola rosea]|nr:Ig-like domain-containing protein [Echinicola rosea]